VRIDDKLAGGESNAKGAATVGKRKFEQEPPRKKASGEWRSGLLMCAGFVVALGLSLRVQHRADANSNNPTSFTTRLFEPTIPNSTHPDVAVPEGMAWIPGGEFSMGAQDPPEMDPVGMAATVDARPVHRIYVDGFYMDTTDVTNKAKDQNLKGNQL